MSAELATVSFRTASGVVEDESWTIADSAVLSNAVPWRTLLLAVAGAAASTSLHAGFRSP
jgi:hypothetical protein